SPFQAQIVEALHSSAVSNDFNLIMMQSQDSEEIEKKAINTLINHGVEGILISPAFENSNLQLLTQLHKSTCPIVIFDRLNYNLGARQGGCHRQTSLYQATEELIRIGRNNVALVCGKDIGLTGQRLRDYMQALQDHQIEMINEYIIYCNYNNSLQGIDAD